MAEETLATITDWKMMPREERLAIAVTQPDLPVEVFTAIMLQTVTDETVRDKRAGMLNEAMIQWTEAQLERFNLAAVPTYDLQVTFPTQLHTQRLMLGTLLDRLFEIEAIDETRYTEFKGKLPVFPTDVVPE